MVPCPHFRSHPVAKPWGYLGLLNAVILQAVLIYLKCLLDLLKQAASFASLAPNFHHAAYPVCCLQSDLPEALFILGSKARTSLWPAYQVQTCLTFKVFIIWFHPTYPTLFFYYFLKCVVHCFREGWLAVSDFHLPGKDISILGSEHVEFEKVSKKMILLHPILKGSSSF